MAPRQRAGFVIRSSVVALAIVALSAATTLSGTAHAAPVTYTDFAAFSTAISGATSSSTLDFEGSTAGDLIADGGALGGVTFNYPTLAGFGVSLQVVDDFNTTSPNNYLGTDDVGVLQDGDDFSIDFGASNAVGLYFITADVGGLIGDDVRLTAGGTTLGLDIAVTPVDLLDGGFAYFLGIIDAGGSFTNASVETSHDTNGFFLWNVDDIILADVPAPIPVPPALPLFAAGLAGLWAFGRRRKKA